MARLGVRDFHMSHKRLDEWERVSNLVSFVFSQSHSESWLETCGVVDPPLAVY
jgi:hypothetical protein